MARPGDLELLEELLDRVADALDLDCEIEVLEEDGELRGTLHGDELGLFIGRHGQTIDAVQHLAQRVLAAAAGGRSGPTVFLTIPCCTIVHRFVVIQ